MKYINLLQNYVLFFILENIICGISKSHNRKDNLPLCLKNQNPYIQCATLNLKEDFEIQNLFQNEIFKKFAKLIENLSDKKEIKEKIENEQDFNDKSVAILKSLIDSSKWDLKQCSRINFLSYLNESIRLIGDFRPLLDKKKEFKNVIVLPESISKIVSEGEKISILLPLVVQLFEDKKDKSRFKSIKDALNSFEIYIKGFKEKFENYQILLFKNYPSYNEAYNLLKIQDKLKEIAEYVNLNKKWDLEEINESKSSYECVFGIFTLLSNNFQNEKDHLDIVLRALDRVSTTKEEIIYKLKSLKKTVTVKIRKFKEIQSE